MAISWLVYRLTDSAVLLGLVSFAGQLPAVIVTPLAGVVVDRWNRHHVLLLTQVSAMVHALTLAALTFTGLITLWSLIVLSLLQGVINAIDMPTRQAFVIELVEEKTDLANAIALNSAMVNLGRLLGPAVGGVVIATMGEAWCFLFDGFSYIAVVASLLLMQRRPLQCVRPATRVGQQLREGWTYMTRLTPMRNVLLLVAIVSLVGMPYAVVLPVFAREVLHGGSHTLGWLMTASGVGALAGAVFLTTRRSVTGLEQWLPWATGVFGVGLMVLAATSTLWSALLMQAVMGLSVMLQLAVSNTLLQTLVAEDKRGRVMSFYTLALMGPLPFGSLFAGMLAHSIGLAATFLSGGLLCVLAAWWFARSLAAVRHDDARATEEVVTSQISHVRTTHPRATRPATGHKQPVTTARRSPVSGPGRSVTPKATTRAQS